MTRKEKAPMLGGGGAEKKLSTENSTITATSDASDSNISAVTLQMQDLKAPHKPWVCVCPPLEQAFEVRVRQSKPVVLRRPVSFSNPFDTKKKIQISTGKEVRPTVVTPETCELLEQQAKETDRALVGGEADSTDKKPWHDIDVLVSEDIPRWLQENGLPEDEFFFDEFTREVTVRERFPGARDEDKFPRSLIDRDVLHVKSALAKFTKVRRDEVRDALYLYADLHARDTLKDAYRALPTWDGTPRAGRLFVSLLGAPDTEIVHRMTTVWMMGAVERAMNPGSRFDYCLILAGGQGKLKSSVCCAICVNQDFFTDVLNSMRDSRKVIEDTTGAHIVELAELDTLKSTKSVEMVKAFITRRVDRARRAYAHEGEKFPRRFVMIGTTNSDRFLVDTTGNRRFLVVPVGNAHLLDYDSPEGREYIAQAWAEILHHWDESKNGDYQWRPYLTADEEQAANELRGQYEDVDPIVDTILEYLEDHRGVVVNPTKVGREALNLCDMDLRDRTMMRRIADVLSNEAEGWEKIGSARVDGKPRKNCYRYTGDPTVPTEYEDVRKTIVNQVIERFWRSKKGELTGTADQLLRWTYQGDPKTVTPTDFALALRKSTPALNAKGIAVLIDETVTPYKFSLRKFNWPIE